MADLNRRTATLLTMLAPLTGSSVTARPSRQMSGETIAMLLYPGMTELDLIGPHTMFAGLTGAELLLVAKTPAPITGEAGVTLVPNATFDTCPRDLTMIFVPGGTEGTIAAARDPAILTFIRSRGARAGYVTSVCTGSLVLGAAGLLDGYRATSHWSCRDTLAGFGAIPTDGRVVRDRNRVTGAGVTSGLDFGLTMLMELHDRDYAETCQLINEYDPQPPFTAGSPKTAPAAAIAHAKELLAPFQQQATALVRAYRRHTRDEFRAT